MTVQLIYYPKCSTCQKAKKWLESHGHVSIDLRLIVEDCPTEEELKKWVAMSKLPLKRFFNTSGVSYKTLNLKEQLPNLSEEEQLKLLATDGKLIKRPLLIGDDFVLVGFNEEEWKLVI